MAVLGLHAQPVRHPARICRTPLARRLASLRSMPAALVRDIAAEGMGLLQRLHGSVVISLNVGRSISLIWPTQCRSTAGRASLRCSEHAPAMSHDCREISSAAARLLGGRHQTWLGAIIPDGQRSLRDEVMATPTEMFNEEWLGKDPIKDPILAAYFLFHDCDHT